MKEFKNILIFGLGLIGGSIAKKLKDSSYSGQVYGFDKDPEILQKAKNQNLILNDSIHNFEYTNDLLVVFCVPVLSFRNALETALSLFCLKNRLFLPIL